MLFQKKPKEVDDLTITLEPIGFIEENCHVPEHYELPHYQAIVRFQGKLCNVAVPACQKPECQEAALEKAKELATDMIAKHQLQVLNPALL